MPTPTQPETAASHDAFTRREFVKTSALGGMILAAGGLSAIPSLSIARTAHAAGSDALKVGVIGCGGRGTGAAVDALTADPSARVVALADLFKDRVDSARANLAAHEGVGERAAIADDRLYTGFDNYQKLLASDVDVVILATAPGFRPIHFEAAIAAGKHVFMEKPVAVDSVGVRRVIAAAQAADAKKLCVVSGTQRRHENSYLAAMKKIREGAIGDIVSARCYWNQGGLWDHERKPEYSEMEWQIRNWLYFTWTSGDHIVEQHIHNIDVINWAMNDVMPDKCQAMGGRQVRTQPKYGHIFDHFACEFTYPNGVVLHSYCRQIEGCTTNVSEVIHGTKGTLTTSPGRAVIEGENPWRFTGENPSPYVQEHIDLFTAIRSGSHVNEGKRVAQSTLSAIMGRTAAYTGKEVTWKFMSEESQQDLSPPKYEFGDVPPTAVAIPGRTPLI
jgi:predicted dehydrogenase